MSNEKISLTTLGSQGWMPTQSRHTCCYCLEYRNTLIIFDAGTGIVRFEETYGEVALKKYKKIIILLSHYHLDHVIGLTFLSRFFHGKTVHIGAPGKSIYEMTVVDILTQLIGSPFYGKTLTEFPVSLHFHDLGRGTTTIEGIEIECILQEHSDPSLGFKINGMVSYITDTCISDATADFVRGSKLLLHEAWFDTHDYITLMQESKSSPDARLSLRSHSHVNRVAEVAERASIGQLVLIHLNPTYDEHRLEQMEYVAKGIFKNSRLAVDGQTINIAT